MRDRPQGLQKKATLQKRLEPLNVGTPMAISGEASNKRIISPLPGVQPKTTVNKAAVQMLSGD